MERSEPPFIEVKTLGTFECRCGVTLMLPLETFEYTCGSGVACKCGARYEASIEIVEVKRDE